MERAEARKILIEYVKACREDDMPTLEKFEYEEILEAMSIGAEALSTSESSEDLEAEIKRYIPRDQCPVPDLMEAVARHFAEWQKEQMLKDAVEGTVCKDKKCVWIELIPNALPDYEDIEPVKCVVMKED